MSLNTWMICGLALYVCFVIYVGFLGAKKIKGLSDFAVAGESMGPIPLGLAFAASFFSAATFMGYVGFCYAWGSTGMWIFLAIFCASTLGFILLAKGVRNSNVELKSISGTTKSSVSRTAAKSPHPSTMATCISACRSAMKSVSQTFPA